MPGRVFCRNLGVDHAAVRNDQLKLSGIGSVADVVGAAIPAGEDCTLAFPVMIVRPDIRTAAFAAIFQTEAVIAWQPGVFKKKTEHVVIRLADIIGQAARE